MACEQVRTSNSHCAEHNVLTCRPPHHHILSSIIGRQRLDAVSLGLSILIADDVHCIGGDDALESLDEIGCSDDY